MLVGTGLAKRDCLDIRSVGHSGRVNPLIPHLFEELVNPLLLPTSPTGLYDLPIDLLVRLSPLLLHIVQHLQSQVQLHLNASILTHSDGEHSEPHTEDVEHQERGPVGLIHLDKTLVGQVKELASCVPCFELFNSSRLDQLSLVDRRVAIVHICLVQSQPNVVYR
jgi:hypothetical protein